MPQTLRPKPPYWTVIFSSHRTPHDDEDYEVAAQRMVDLASQQPGFLGVESARDPQGFGLTISYWTNQDAIKAWRDHPEHQAVQAMGRDKWYRKYDVRVAEVKHSYHFDSLP